ncbi:PD-(D/E)XK nuclease family protein, partial [Acinetobacter baumannii]
MIIDYKTTKKGMWRKDTNTIRKDLQLRCYGRVVQREFGAKAENIMAALYYLEGGNLVATKFTEQSLASSEKELLDAYNQIVT